MHKKINKPKNLTIKNRKASFDYIFLDKYIAGIVLTGTEIKSIRAGQVNLQDAYCYYLQDEIWIKQMHIAPYAHGNIYNHDVTRERKLLLKKKQIRKLIQDKEKTLTIIPIQLFINERGWAKLEIALARGKKLYDKRQAIKEREITRELQRHRL
jgi:SsrA-binding protein